MTTGEGIPRTEVPEDSGRGLSPPLASTPSDDPPRQLSFPTPNGCRSGASDRECASSLSRGASSFKKSWISRGRSRRAPAEPSLHRSRRQASSRFESFLPESARSLMVSDPQGGIGSRTRTSFRWGAWVSGAERPETGGE